MNFVTIDFETANYSRNSACSVGMVKYQGGEKTDTFYSLIRPPRLYIRPDFTDIHGLTINDVKDAPTFAAIWESKMLPFIGDLPIVAHNANFDMGVLRAVLECYELPTPSIQYFCSLKIARKTWTYLSSHALTSLAKRFGIEYNAHNALDDAETCGKMVQLSAEEYGAVTIDELLSALGLEMSLL
ncbi:MAG: 3'-5' exonuclease [Treponema sp.]|jgi:DNA polymerase-3 subunit epsilon|nr:3'-5' exonuclease [Treponema sp.]